MRNIRYDLNKGHDGASNTDSYLSWEVDNEVYMGTEFFTNTVYTEIFGPIHAGALQTSLGVSAGPVRTFKPNSESSTLSTPTRR